MQIRLSSSMGSLTAEGMIFVSATKPDFDAFEWCDNFSQRHFDALKQKKLATGQPWKSHEPIAFFSIPSGCASWVVKLEQPRRGKYVAVKMRPISPPGQVITLLLTLFIDSFVLILFIDSC